MSLKETHKNTLLGIAKWAVIDFLESKKQNPLPSEFHIDPTLRQLSGVFVSVYVNNKLRGCIGTFSENEELIYNVRKMAVQAATQDQRFLPVELTEINNLNIELSVLTPRQQISDINDIQIGKHGIYLIQGNRRGTLLPQVAVEHNWSVLDFLECCASNKMGLSPSDWKKCEIYTYEAEVFS